MRVGAVVPAAGRGARFGSPENKIWAPLAGRPLIRHTLEVFQRHRRVEWIVIAGAPDDLARLRALARDLDKVHDVVPGGERRQQSVERGLAALPEACDAVLIHDAARPLVSGDVLDRVLDGVAAHGAAVPCLPLHDTIKRVVGGGRILETVPREQLHAAQTPQGALRATLMSAYRALGDRAALATDEAGILEQAGFPVWSVPGDEDNLKVTLPGDMARAERILAARADGPVCEDRPAAASGAAEVRTGFGYDVHAFGEGRALWLGGVRIPEARGLVGHSDADVLLHAVCDALLGAAGMGDIGVLFPDTDAAHKDRPSIEFVCEVGDRLAADSWCVRHVDVCVLAEEPRIGPHRARMTAVLADGLHIATTQVNIKATTSEGLGFIGRREGIACWAVATLTREARRAHSQAAGGTAGPNPA